MAATSILQTTLLSRLNERQVFQTIQTHGPLSRAEVARLSGISAPTASKAIEALLRAGLLQEDGAKSSPRGRPARKLRLATQATQILGVIVAPETCQIVASGLDGRIRDGQRAVFPTPGTYEELIQRIGEAAESLASRAGVRTLGMGITLPGLIDNSEQRILLSINIPITNGRAPGRDLTDRLPFDSVVVQDSHALCLAERHFGAARGRHDFAILDIAAGVGMGIFTGSRLLTGHRGFAGEIGHITVDPSGERCACGNWGCLETVASEPAFLRALGRRFGRPVAWEEALSLIHHGIPEAVEEADRMCRFLGIGIGAAVTMLNPSMVFVHGRFFSAHPQYLDRVLAEAGRSGLRPSLRACELRLGTGSKQQGAIAAVIEHLTDKLAPGILDRTLSSVPPVSHRARRAESG